MTFCHFVFVDKKGVNDTLYIVLFYHFLMGGGFFSKKKLISK
jgi:hypothetical protein